MPRYRLVVSYDGTDFAGWQVQPGQRTVQGVIEAAVGTLFQHPIRLRPSGRTDAGVHALKQVAVFDSDTSRDCRQIASALNALTPNDVAIVQVDEAPSDFDPRRWAREKHYRYRWQLGPVCDPHRRRVCRWAKGPFGVESANEAVAQLVGKHDFASFRAVGCASSHAVRTVASARVLAVGDEIHLDVTGNGFLRHMVRIIAGSVEQVGLSRRSPQWLAQVLQARERNQAGPTLPANGLSLIDTVYGDGPPPWMRGG